MKRYFQLLHSELTEETLQGFALRMCLYITVAGIVFSGIMDYATQTRFILYAQLENPEVFAVQTPTQSTLLSNVLLFRLKKESNNKFNSKSPLDSEIQGIKNVQTKYKIKKFEQLVKTFGNATPEANIFSWYKITLNETGERIKGIYDNKAKKLFSTHSKGKRLNDVISVLKSDPDIELIEPDYTVYATQTDTLVPSTPTNLAASDITATSVKLQWNASTDNFGITGYNIFRNGTKITQVNAVTYTNTDLTPGSIYTYTIQAEDAAGNKSSQSLSVAVNTLTSFITTTPSPTPTTAQKATPTPRIVTDPYYSSSKSWKQLYLDMWGMKKINPEKAWKEATPSGSVIIGVIDSGIDRTHEDLKANMWVNSKETNGNKKDDDLNGYVDDYYGWDFMANSNNPTDTYGHGTQMAGVIAAVGNNAIGVVGVNWNAKLMNLKFIQSNGMGEISNAVRAIQYATDMGVNVLNMSYGIHLDYAYAPLEDALQYAHDSGVTIVASSGNDNENASDNMPASSPYVIVAGAIDQNDKRTAVSNLGEKLDVVAPGANILSTRAAGTTTCPTIVGSRYCVGSGTSYAAAHVSGLAAFIISANSSLTNEQIRQLLRNTADDLGTPRRDNQFGYGRINVSHAIDRTTNPPVELFIFSPKPKTTISGDVAVLGSANGTQLARYTVEIGSGRTPSKWIPQIDIAKKVNNGTLATIKTSTYPSGIYSIRVTAYDTDKNEYFFQISDITIKNTASSSDGSAASGSASVDVLVAPTIHCTTLPNGLAWNWNGVSGTKSYWLQIMTPDGKEWLLNQWVLGTTYNATGKAGIKYRARIKSGNGKKQSAWSKDGFCTMPLAAKTSN